MFDFFKKKKTETKEIDEVISTKIDENYEDVSLVAEYFKNETGVTFDKQESVLKNKLTTFCRMRDIPTFLKLLKITQSDADVKQELIDYLTTNETFFYREFNQISELTELAKEKSGSISIICAPSATGEEPYSIAIALLESGMHPDKFKILGIDINAEAIQKAKTAVYRERNIRNLSEAILEKHFINDNGTYILREHVKSLVTFKIANIFDKSFVNLGKFDFIFSRNMLIYFNQETKLEAKRILENMRKDTNQDIFFGHADLFNAF